MSAAVRVSLVLTVLNEASSIERLLDTSRAQTRQPDEIVIVDGGSRDGTPDRVRALAAGLALPVQLLERPGASISAGRNAAIAAAAGPIVAVTDAGVRLDSNWLARLIAPFEAPDPPDLVAGFFVPDLTLGRGAGAFPGRFRTALAATIQPAVEDIDPERFLPSSRSVAFRRDLWQAVGGYPEWLDYCEDLVFDLSLRAAGARFQFAPEALVYFAPRESWGAFFRQYYYYARGDGKADLWRRRQAIRYGTYFGALAFCYLTRRRPWLWPALAVPGVAYCRRPAERFVGFSAGWPVGARLAGLTLIPAIRVWGDLAKLIGYPVGVRWRLTHRPPSHRKVRPRPNPPGA